MICVEKLAVRITANDCYCGCDADEWHWKIRMVIAKHDSHVRTDGADADAMDTEDHYENKMVETTYLRPQSIETNDENIWTSTASSLQLAADVRNILVKHSPGE